ncbi:hypothetical protein SAMN05216382_0794 [Sphingomonas palmae]|uniref:Sel1 repeat-containing protein n=1 Tax=Sphingomonas palmae TaxID=1855283 RepID=A0A1H7IK41_9SPHN|nr:hypothetical protein [Sphingomonas palmae]SEK62829.1 hypothetical protein SAMN05216382_0794 [Sphingomonas palmae]
MRALRIIGRWLAAAMLIASTAPVQAQAQPEDQQQNAALRRLIRAAKNRPYAALSWHELKLAATNERQAQQLKDALAHSGRSLDDVSEQSMWVDAAAGHPEAIISFYDDNALNHPEDKTRLNTACWARAARGIDLENSISVCDLAIAADRKGYTLLFRGLAELQLGLNIEALRDFDEALGDKQFAAHPFLADAAFGRGIARIRLGDAEGHKDIRAATAANKNVVTNFTDIGITEELSD